MLTVVFVPQKCWNNIQNNTRHLKNYLHRKNKATDFAACHSKDVDINNFGGITPAELCGPVDVFVLVVFLQLQQLFQRMFQLFLAVKLHNVEQTSHDSQSALPLRDNYLKFWINY